jgi:hypothetical protein
MIPPFGSAIANGELDLILNDLIADMGSAIPSEIGSLSWCESFVVAKSIAASLQYYRLMASQLSPANMSIFADRYAKMYGLSGQSNAKNTIEELLYQTGTFPNLNNVKSLLSNMLGNIFIDLEWAPEIQNLATRAPVTGSGLYFSPLSTLYVRVWQPRDNQDNLLVPTNIFNQTVSNFVKSVDRWLPATTPVVIMQFISVGAYQTYNTVSVSSGSNIVSGTNTTFTYDFADVNALGYQMPIEVVDDNNNLQTFLISHVVNDTQLILTEPVLANVNNRTYRCLGIPMDTDGVLDWALFNS